MSPVRYELGFIPEDDILHSHCREILKSYIINRSFFIISSHCSFVPSVMSSPDNRRLHL
jgi:hypothetical protein